MIKFLIMFRNNGPLVIYTLALIAGIHALVDKSLPTWLFIGVILSTLLFAYNIGKFLYLKFKHN